MQNQPQIRVVTSAGGYAAKKNQQFYTPVQNQVLVVNEGQSKIEDGKDDKNCDRKLTIKLPCPGKCKSKLGLNFNDFTSPFKTQGCFYSWLSIFLVEVLATAAVVWLGVMVSGSTTLEPIRNIVGPIGWAAGTFLASAAWTYWIVHMNPILTVALFILSDNDKHRDPMVAVSRILGAFGGAFLGCALALVLVGYDGVALSAIYPRDHGLQSIGSFSSPAVDYTVWHGFGAELLASTWVLLGTVFILIVYTKPVDDTKYDGSSRLDLRGLIACYFVELVGLYSIWNITGAGLNIAHVVAVNTIPWVWGDAGEKWGCSVGVVCALIPVLLIAYFKWYLAANNKKWAEEAEKAEKEENKSA